jgi:hypothetical protein
MRTYAFLPALLAIFSLTGCVRDVAVTTVPNPAVSGVSADTRVAVSYPLQESQRGLPVGTLDDEATITSFDANQVCVGIALRAVDEGAGESWSVLENFDISLETSDGRRLTPATYQASEATMQQYQGYVPTEVVVRVDRVCTQQNPQGQCTRWTDQPVTETQWLPGIVHVHTGGGGLCFQHAGAINPATQSIRLALRRTARRVDFQWSFTL